MARNGILIILITLLNCAGKKDQVDSTPTVSRSIEVVASQVDIDSIKINLDTYSRVGRFAILNDKLAFLDQIFQTITFIDTNFNIQGVYAGRGIGPNEVDNVHFTTDLGNSSYLVIDNFGFHEFLNDSTKKYFKLFDWDIQTPLNELLAKPNGEQKGIYSIDWSPSTNSNFVSYRNGHLFLPIITEHPELNAFQHKTFYNETYSIGKFRKTDGKLVEMGANWSPSYRQFNFIPNLVGIDITNSSEGLIITNHIDSLMSVYDDDLQLIGRFGVNGEGFDIDYQETRTVDEAIDNWDSDLENQSFYSSVFAHQKLAFRVYHPKGKQGPTRVQVYEDKILTHDAQVPHRFRVIGKIGEYFYADGQVNEFDDIPFIYRFKLNE